MWADVELRELRVFLAIAEHLHFGRAAEAVGVTPSRASQSLRSLEAKLGVPLVHRTSRRVELTVAGRRFHDRVAGPLRQAEDVLRETAAQPGGVLRLGLFNAASGGPRMTDVIAAFEKEHPDCSVEIVELPFRDRYGPLLRGEVDVMAARVPLDEPGITVGPTLSVQPRVLCLRHDHPLAARESITTEDIADHRVINADMLPGDLAEAMVPTVSVSGRPIRRLTARVESTAELMMLIARGEAVHPTVPAFAENVRHPDVVTRPISDLPPSRSALAWKSRHRDPRLRAFTDTARTILRTAADR